MKQETWDFLANEIYPELLLVYKKKLNNDFSIDCGTDFANHIRDMEEE